MFAAMHESVHRTAFKSRGSTTRWRGSPGCCRSTTAPSTGPTTAGITASRNCRGKIQSWRMRSRPAVLDYFVRAERRAVVARQAAHTLQVGGRQDERLRLPQRRDSDRASCARCAVSFACTPWRSARVSGLPEPYFVIYWLVPVALAQPLLRAILLAEHMGCSETTRSAQQHAHHVHALAGALLDVGHAVPRRSPPLSGAAFFFARAARTRAWVHTSRTLPGAAIRACISASCETCGSAYLSKAEIPEEAP